MERVETPKKGTLIPPGPTTVFHFGAMFGLSRQVPSSSMLSARCTATCDGGPKTFQILIPICRLERDTTGDTNKISTGNIFRERLQLKAGIPLVNGMPSRAFVGI